MIEWREHLGSYFPPEILTDLLSHSMDPWRDGSCNSELIFCQFQAGTVFVTLRFDGHFCLCKIWCS